MLHFGVKLRGRIPPNPLETTRSTGDTGWDRQDDAMIVPPASIHVTGAKFPESLYRCRAGTSYVERYP